MKLSANTVRSIKHAVLAFLAVFLPQLLAISGPVTTKVILGLVASAAVVVFRQLDPPPTPSPSPGDSASAS